VAGFSDGSIARLAQWRGRIEQTVLESVAATGVNGQGAPRVPNTANIYFDGIEGEALVIALDLKGIAVSTGAACSSGAVEPSHVLTAMGLSAGRARASLRFSLGRHNAAGDAEHLLSLLPESVSRLRELSPAYKT
jgi:cysteine desulfurase